MRRVHRCHRNLHNFISFERARAFFFVFVSVSAIVLAGSLPFVSNVAGRWMRVWADRKQCHKIMFTLKNKLLYVLWSFECPHNGKRDSLFVTANIHTPKTQWTNSKTAKNFAREKDTKIEMAWLWIGEQTDLFLCDCIVLYMNVPEA